MRNMAVNGKKKIRRSIANMPMASNMRFVMFICYSLKERERGLFKFAVSGRTFCLHVMIVAVDSKEHYQISDKSACFFLTKLFNY